MPVGDQTSDGHGTPLKVITTAANANDVTQTLAFVDGIPPMAGRPGRPRRRPASLLGDKVYDSNPNRREMRRSRTLSVISRKGAPNIKGLGKLRYVVEQIFALLHQFKRLAVRWERRTELHDAFVSLACSLICWKRLKEAHSLSSYEPMARFLLFRDSWECGRRLLFSSECSGRRQSKPTARNG
ncbi:transposase [Streptomyces sp. NPDC127119]|uniref:transposase n=1 Tax=Streptomyces sp. NPDC127119 TaxID=3345370 RepID=UPI00363F5ECB